MSEKPEALRLAQEFELHVAFGSGMTIRRTEIEAVAAELRRQHAEIERLHDELRQSSIDIARAKIERLREALESIAANACCDRCQEAALVAKAALRRED